ncbi:hypothetical protein JW826_05215 [Candidatus Woesearchaeota archaeon]|nr:hypothetical protein [Candidatus Woesearchaeota archaeon]
MMVKGGDGSEGASAGEAGAVKTAKIVKNKDEQDTSMAGGLSIGVLKPGAGSEAKPETFLRAASPDVSPPDAPPTASSSQTGSSQPSQSITPSGAPLPLSGARGSSLKKRTFSRLSLKFLGLLIFMMACLVIASFFFAGNISIVYVDLLNEKSTSLKEVCAASGDSVPSNAAFKRSCELEMSKFSSDVIASINDERVHNQSKVMVYVSCIIVFMFVLFFIFYRKLISNPLDLIQQSFFQIEKGNLDVKIRMRSGDEFEDLASSFNKVLVHLKNSKNILEYNETELKRDLIFKTNELNNKIRELEETRTAILNILEDVNLSKEDLESSQTQLLKLNKDMKAANDELKKMDSYKNQFISVTAHELKTPLASIHGFASLLQNKGVADSAKQRNSYLKIIVEEADRLKRLIDDILDLSRLDLGTMNFVFEDVDPNEAIKSVHAELNVLASKRSQVLKIDIPNKLPLMRVDKTRLTQVLVNLVNNSIKYSTKSGGRIVISASVKGGSVVFSVKDEGIGIPKSAYSHIFQRFYQVDASFTRKVGGTGLGLSICKGLVQAMGGSIWFSSQPGKGSTFSFSLPIKSEKSDPGLSSEKNISVIDTDLKRPRSGASKKARVSKGKDDTATPGQVPKPASSPKKGNNPGPKNA